MKRVISVLLTVAICVSMLSGVVVASENHFLDVSRASYYYDAVLWAVEEGITSGKTETIFDPEGLCTRAQAVTFLWRYAGKPVPVSQNNPFTDVSADQYYTDAVLWAVEQGITTGLGNGIFALHDSCTRAQIVTFLYRLICAAEDDESGSARPSHTPILPPTPPTPPTPDEPDEPAVVTRADIENALAETAWAFYMKDVWIQYDSIDLNTRVDGDNQPLSRWMSGFTRLDTHLTRLEDANSDDTMYSVCSYLPWAVYYEVMDYPLFGCSLNASTMGLWLYAEVPDDMLVLRHHNWEENTNTSELEDGYVFHDKCVDREELEEFLRNWDENLRPGDIFYAIDGHAAMYVGNGWIIESAGHKLNLVTGADTLEANGSIQAWTVEDYFFNEDSGSMYNLSNLDVPQQKRIAILRPLDLLTKDDGDGNPDNDLIDESYELHMDRLNLKFDSDPNELRTKGFYLQDSAVSRVDYPAMNIDKTVGITSYGNAVKGGTLTYTVSISNESNNADYTTWRSVGGEAYSGEDYTGLSIIEIIPKNTELVSAPDAQADGSTLRWTIDVPVGETVSVSYTVMVTGEIGDEIVNSGGFVDDILTNTIINTIGGAKLNSETTTAMQNFFAAGPDQWNSNEGYKISANVNEGTRFAERIYNETAGLDLQLPTVQELADMLFTQTLVHEDGGMYYQYENEVERWMYTLNETTADPANQIYRDMVIDGYYGGVWVWANIYAGEPRIDEMRFDYLEPGDILVYMNLTDSISGGTAVEDRDVTQWRVQVYLGDGKFASLTEIGRLSAISDTSAVLSAFTYDMFVALRPSQVYTDLNTEIEVYTGSADDLTEKDKAWRYVPNISNILMGERLSGMLAAMTDKDGWKKVNTDFVGEVYSALGIPEPAAGIWTTSYASILKAIFSDATDEAPADSFYGAHAYYLLEEPNSGTETLYDMLLYYGGPAYVDQKPVSSLKDLHPGDAILLGLRAQRHYLNAVYQGNGKFLTSLQSLPGGVFNYGNQHGSLSFDSDEEFLAWLTGPVNSEDPSYPTLCFEGYLVLRPSRVYEDINAAAIRDLKDGPLTDAERAAMQALKTDDWTAASSPINLNNAAPWFYQSAKISVSKYLSESIYWTYAALFDDTAMLRTADDTKFNPDYRIMLLGENYGGTWFGDRGKDKLDAEDLLVGDIFAGAKQVDGQTCYWTALYQGDGQFLVVQNHNSGSITCFTDDSSFYQEGFASTWEYFYVLRPDNLNQKRDMALAPLTDEEKEDLSELLPEDWDQSNPKANLQAAGPWFYESANVDLSNYLTKTINGTYQSLFVKVNGVWTIMPSSNSKFDVTLNSMLVDGFYGGTDFGTTGKSVITADDLEVGDIFAGAKAATGGGTCYWTALYQGDGQFLVVQNFGGGNTTPASCFVDSNSFYENNFTSTWQYFYVLRPSQLAYPVENRIRDIKTGVLTEDEKAVLSALTSEDWQKGGTLTNLNYVGPWFYRTAKIDLSAYLTKSVYWTYDALFQDTDEDGIAELRESDDESYDANLGAMLVSDFYGGSYFGTTGKAVITTDELEIGDIFAGTKAADGGGSCYWTALYQGSGKLLVVQNFGGGNATAASCFVDSTSFYETEFTSTWQYFYVLRPNQLATTG